MLQIQTWKGQLTGAAKKLRSMPPDLSLCSEQHLANLRLRLLPNSPAHINTVDGLMQAQDKYKSYYIWRLALHQL